MSPSQLQEHGLLAKQIDVLMHQLSDCCHRALVAAWCPQKEQKHHECTYAGGAPRKISAECHLFEPYRDPYSPAPRQTVPQAASLGKKQQSQPSQKWGKIVVLRVICRERGTP